MGLETRLSKVDVGEAVTVGVGAAVGAAAGGWLGAAAGGFFGSMIYDLAAGSHKYG